MRINVTSAIDPRMFVNKPLQVAPQSPVARPLLACEFGGRRRLGELGESEMKRYAAVAARSGTTGRQRGRLRAYLLFSYGQTRSMPTGATGGSYGKGAAYWRGGRFLRGRAGDGYSHATGMHGKGG